VWKSISSPADLNKSNLSMTPSKANSAAPSFEVSTYVDQTAYLIGLPLPAGYHEGVISNFERICAIAQPLLEFSVPDDIEAAPIFTPECNAQP
jgi:hypothetical protein